MILSTHQRLSLAMTAMQQALEKGQPEATRVRRIKWILQLLKGLGEEAMPRRLVGETRQDLAPHVLRHRIWLGPHAASHGLTSEAVIKDVIERVAIP